MLPWVCDACKSEGRYDFIIPPSKVSKNALGDDLVYKENADDAKGCV